MALAAWVADYYACGVGEAVAAAMPPRAWIESERHAQITEAGRVRISGERGLRRTVLEKLQAGAPVRVRRLTRRAAASTLRWSRSNGTAWSR